LTCLRYLQIRISVGKSSYCLRPTFALSVIINYFKGIDDVEGPCVNLNTMRVLKYCNQSIVAPAIVELKLLLRDYGYIDGGWTVAVDIQTDWIVVTHTRSELFTAGVSIITKIYLHQIYLITVEY